jgi:hypothetical protein
MLTLSIAQQARKKIEVLAARTLQPALNKLNRRFIELVVQNVSSF